ncbi:MAG: slipin family protein, partial [Chloroflexi bacterium]
MIIAVAGAAYFDSQNISENWIGVWVTVMTLIGTYLLFAFKVAAQWDKAIVLRFGKFRSLSGPGPFWIIPIVDTIPNWIDHRVMVTPFAAEKTLTKDTVPVDVDAVLFWVVWDAE